ncbi:hypothetical protein BASA61_002936 [Batrachochytrium salamandrivorans]|nr:hypothetical protein BASA60_004482 [Batrachochytrium salamandrivorans]KAH6598189.1 hypothetical protein BASA61_002936 [Batrachochytrium salamandrivorans]KAH9263842.1 hypothetical protein BASA83_012719 [Batrachochytrium salamandrivorans]
MRGSLKGGAAPALTVTVPEVDTNSEVDRSSITGADFSAGGGIDDASGLEDTDINNTRGSEGDGVDDEGVDASMSDTGLNESTLSSPSIDWTPEMEMTLFQAVVKYRPIGVHKFFRILNVQRFFNMHMGTSISVQELWDHLSLYYHLEKLDDQADDTEMEVPYEKRIHHAIFPFTTLRDFTLPVEDFCELMDERRKAESSSTGSPERVLLEAHSPVKSRGSRSHVYSPTPSSSPVGFSERLFEAASDPPVSTRQKDKPMAATPSVTEAVITPVKPKLGRPRKIKREDIPPSNDAVVSIDAQETSGESVTPHEPSRRSSRHPSTTSAIKKRR